MAKPLEEKWCRNPEKVAEIYLVEASGKNTGTEQGLKKHREGSRKIKRKPV